ncbi:hypothetical protein Tco_0716907 [Tanacetum coccineum]
MAHLRGGGHNVLIMLHRRRRLLDHLERDAGPRLLQFLQLLTHKEPYHLCVLTSSHIARGLGVLRKAFSPEDSIEESMEVGSETHVDSDTLTDIEADIVAETTAAEATTAVEMDTGAEADYDFERDDEVEDDAESSARGIVEIGVDTVVEPEISDDTSVPTGDEGSREYVQIGLDVVMQKLYDHMDNMRLRGMLCIERDRIDSVRRHMGYVQEELRQIRLFRCYDRVDFRTLETFAMRHLGYRP